jgi:hypothetical protein
MATVNNRIQCAYTYQMSVHVLGVVRVCFLAQREMMRRERKRERERDMRMEVLGKKTKTSRDRDRDVTERIALGMQPAGGKLSGDAMYDQRLFNQVRCFIWNDIARCSVYITALLCVRYCCSLKASTQALRTMRTMTVCTPRHFARRTSRFVIFLP